MKSYGKKMTACPAAGDRTLSVSRVLSEQCEPDAAWIVLPSLCATGFSPPETHLDDGLICLNSEVLEADDGKGNDAPRRRTDVALREFGVLPACVKGGLEKWELCPKVGDGVIRRRFEVA